MGNTRKTADMKKEIEDEFAGVNLDITVEEVDELVNGKESAPADNSDDDGQELDELLDEDIPPPMPPKKEEPRFDDFVAKARDIILAKCPDATPDERGKYFKHVVGQNLNQAWASPGSHENVLRMLIASTEPVRPDEAKPQEKEKGPSMPKQTKVAMVMPRPLDISIKTLMGVDWTNIQEFLDHPLPRKAYSPIPYGTMKGKTDIDPIYVRQRVDECFGPQGIGWKIVPGENSSYRADTEQRKTKEGEIQTWYTTRAENYVFKYAAMYGDQIEWVSTSPISEYAENMDAGYCYRSVFSSILKQAMKNMGGLNHVYMGIYTHIEAQKG